MQNRPSVLTIHQFSVKMLFAGIAVLFLAGFAVRTGLAAEEPLPVYVIQGDGYVSPYRQVRVDAYGVVTAVAPTGFYLQDPAGDGRVETSDGIFVYTRERPAVAPSDCVELIGAYVDEFYEKTELSRVKAIRPADQCAHVLPATVPLPAPMIGVPVQAQYERLEGMRVSLPEVVGVVQGPTKRFGNGDVELSFVPSPLAMYLEDGRVHQAAPDEMAALMYLSGALGTALPDANWGDQVAVGAAEAILDFNFGKYQLLLLPGAVLKHVPHPRLGERAQPAADGEFTVCSFNLFGMGRGSAQVPDPEGYAVQLDRRARAIAEILGGCTIVAVQELGTPADGEALASRLQTAYGLDYLATALPGPQSFDDEFPLTNGVLVRKAAARVVAATGGQGCSAVDYGVVDLDVACPDGEYPLFDRPPLVVDLEVAGAWPAPLALRVVANHWKSKGGEESINAPRRLAQAGHVVALLQPLLDVDPTAAAIVLGDLNDYYDSAPVEHLRNGTRPPLVHTADWLSETDRYSYIFNGGSQMLDHLLITEGTAGDVAEINILHVDADYAVVAEPDPASLRHVSDHDPLLVRIRPGAAAWLGGNLGHGGVEVSAFDREGRLAGSALTDKRGDFRLWNLAQGTVRLDLAAPAYLVLPRPAITVTLAAGPNALRIAEAEHAAAANGIAAALATVGADPAMR